MMKISNVKFNEQSFSMRARQGFLLLSLVAGLLACGGGSSGSADSASSNPAEQPLLDDISPSVQFVPDDARLLVEATQSEELFADPGFQFDGNREALLSIYATGLDGKPLKHAKLYVYALSEEFSSWQDIAAGDRELLLTARTNALGGYENVLEVSTLVKQLLVSVAALGIENKVLLQVDDTVSYHFSGQNTVF